MSGDHLRDVVRSGAAHQSQLLASGAVTSRQLTEATLDAIEATQPVLNATVAIYREQALSAADAADVRRSAGDAGPLTGVPIAIKDDLAIGGEPTGWGSMYRDDRH